MKLVVGGKEFAVHKTVLASRSPVFAGMFRNETKESVENRIELADLSVEVCELFLRYIYTGKVNRFSLDRFGVDLLVLADMV